VLRSPRWLAEALPFILLFGAAVAVGAELARPFRAASIAFDAQASVLYFERIVSGQRLEGFVPTTPKPLLTAVFGILYALTHDWRALAWATLLAQGIAVVLSTVLARRIGGFVAAVFTGVALVNNGDLLFEVGNALGSPFALIGWATAGLVVTAARPRYALAGLGLALATLVRVETIVVTGVVLVALLAAMVAPARWGLAKPPLRAWLVPLVGLLAIPTMMAHDLLLAGDPFYWAGVSPHFAAATAHLVPSALQVTAAIVSRYWGMGAVSLLAAIGFVRLVADGRYALGAGLVGLGPGVAAFLILLAARGIEVPIRYTTAIDVAVIFAAGIGISALSFRALSWVPSDEFRRRAGARGMTVATVAFVAAAALLSAGPYWRQNPGVRTSVRSNLQLAVHADRVLPIVSGALAATVPPPAGTPALLVPGSVRLRFVVDLGRSLTEVGGNAPLKLDVEGGYPTVGQVMFHDRGGDAAAPGWVDVETGTPRTVGSVVVEPLLADPAAGIWVIAVR
jgi:hypothetical protein